MRWLQQKALSWALHGPVQATATSGALRLDAAVRAGAPTQDLARDIRADLLALVDVLDSPADQAPPLGAALARIVGAWAGVCTVSPHLSEEALGALADDAVARAVLIDLITEAVSNAVRHSSAGIVLLAGSVRKGLLTVEVMDDGSAGEPLEASAGLGSSLLDTCTLEWSREYGPSGCTLRMVLPVTR